MKHNKKGNAVIEGITIIVVIFVMGMAAIFGSRLFDEMNIDIQADESLSNESKAISDDLYTKYPPLLDNLVLFAFVLFTIFTIVSVFLIDNHPIFFIISIMLLIGLFVVSIILANTFDDVMQDAEFSTYANDFTYTSWLMTHLLEVVISVGFAVSIATFIKLRA